MGSYLKVSSVANPRHSIMYSQIAIMLSAMVGTLGDVIRSKRKFWKPPNWRWSDSCKIVLQAEGIFLARGLSLAC